jgi:hypothetical protein
MAWKEISHVVTTVLSPYCHKAVGGFLLSVLLKLASKRGRKEESGFESLFR